MKPSQGNWATSHGNPGSFKQKPIEKSPAQKKKKKKREREGKKCKNHHQHFLRDLVVDIFSRH